MFSGIISVTSNIKVSDKKAGIVKVVIDKPSKWLDIKLGDSVSINGVCLTVMDIDKASFYCEIVNETLSVSSFSKSFPKVVNLERALMPTDRLDGHIVQGHVDALGEVIKISRGVNKTLAIKYAGENQTLLVYKGSITLDGVALTISKILDEAFEVTLVPYTLEHTTLGSLKTGDMVNLEFDILGKYVVNAIKSWEINAKS